jgi:hypothetical protein
MSVTPLKAIILSVGLLALAHGSRAQSRPAEPATTDVNVRVTVPAAVVAFKDYAAILISKDQDKLKALAARRRRPTPTPVLTFSVALPRSLAKKLETKE